MISMNLIATLPGVPYALRVTIPPKHQAQIGQWLDAEEEYSLLRQKSLAFGRLDADDQARAETAKAHHQTVQRAAMVVAEERAKVLSWLHPLVESHGFIVEVDGEDRCPIIYFDHETLWMRRNPEGKVKDLARLDVELRGIEFDGTVAGLIEALQSFPGPWKMPLNEVTAVGDKQIRISTEFDVLPFLRSLMQ